MQKLAKYVEVEISKETREQLEKWKLSPDETLDSVIDRLLKLRNDVAKF